MTSEYSYKKSINFPNGLNLSILQNDISTSAITSATIQYINTEDDDIIIVFNNQLSNDDVSALNTIVNNHNPVKLEIIDKIDVVKPDLSKVELPHYVLVGNYVYGGSGTMIPFKKVGFISCMTPTSTSYNIRVFDKTNCKVIGESTFTNTDNNNQMYITDLSNIPFYKSQIEIHMKVVGNEAHLVLINFYY